jgi:hypothetical protein
MDTRCEPNSIQFSVKFYAIYDSETCSEMRHVSRMLSCLSRVIATTLQQGHPSSLMPHTIIDIKCDEPLCIICRGSLDLTTTMQHIDRLIGVLWASEHAIPDHCTYFRASCI